MRPALCGGVDLLESEYAGYVTLSQIQEQGKVGLAHLEQLLQLCRVRPVLATRQPLRVPHVL